MANYIILKLSFCSLIFTCINQLNASHRDTPRDREYYRAALPHLYPEYQAIQNISEHYRILDLFEAEEEIRREEVLRQARQEQQRQVGERIREAAALPEAEAQHQAQQLPAAAVNNNQAPQAELDEHQRRLDLIERQEQANRARAAAPVNQDEREPVAQQNNALVVYGQAPRVLQRINPPVHRSERLNQDRLENIAAFPRHKFYNVGLNITEEILKPLLQNFNNKMRFMSASVEFKSGNDFNTELHDLNQIAQSPIRNADRVAVITLNLCGQSTQTIVMKISNEIELSSHALRTQCGRRFAEIQQVADSIQQNAPLAEIVKKSRKTLPGKLCFDVVPNLYYSVCQYIAHDLIDDLGTSIKNSFNRKNLDALKEKVSAPNAQTINADITAFKGNQSLYNNGTIIKKIDEQNPVRNNLEAMYCELFQKNLSKQR